MANLDLQSVLGAPNLCGLIQETKPRIPNPFPPEFYAVDKQVDGDNGSYFKVQGQRGVATLSPYGAAPKSAQMAGIIEMPVKLFHSVEEINLPLLAYQRLLKYDDLAVQKMGLQEVQRQVQYFKDRYANLRIASMVAMLFSGQVAYDVNGNFLPPNTSNPANLFSFGIPTNNNTPAAGVGSNIGTAVDPLGTGTAIIGSSLAAWSNPATNIDQQVRALRQAASILTGYEIQHAFYGKNIPTWLGTNNTLENYMSRGTVVINGQGGFNQQFAGDGEVPNGLLGLKWHKAYNSFFQDQNGVNQPLVGDNQILFTPEPSLDWLGVLEGSYATPNNPFKLSAADASIVSGADVRYGMFSYGVPCMKPPTATIVAGDTFFNVLKNPKAVFSVTVA